MKLRFVILRGKDLPEFGKPGRVCEGDWEKERMKE